MANRCSTHSRVNHSGEFGAIGIYQSQLFLARMIWPSGRDLLAEMLVDERRHLNVFAGMLAQRNIRPCYAPHCSDALAATPWV